ncbi:MAG: GNAT family N-acetyltransferase [bacterium]
MTNSNRVEQFLMVRDLIDLTLSPNDLTAPDGYELKNYEEGFESCWNEVHHSVFPDKKRHFHQKYLKNPDMVFMSDHFFFVFEQTTEEPAGINTAQVKRINDEYLANLDWIAVKTEHRGHGIGKTLMYNVLNRFKEDGFTKASLRTADMPSRADAKRLYEQTGWEIVNKGSPEDMWEMQKTFVESPDPLLSRI